MNKGEIILEIIKRFELSEGSWEEKKLKSLGKNKLYIFRATNSPKVYFFYSVEEGSLKDNFEQLDIALEENNIKIKPQDSYLTMFYEISDDSPQYIKEIIPIEENEFRFKKYVFYYTNDEIQAAISRVRNYFSENIWLYENMKQFNDPVTSFLHRLIIKVPIIKLGFNTKEMSQFGDFFDMRKGRIGNIELEKLNMEVDNYISRNISSNIIVEELIKKVYGGGIYEYLSEQSHNK